ncbi:hypothetical protein KWR14_006435 [Clostridioides difficile]|nr:hypothetical protein [uncultured Clostridioides sp.]EGT5420858.1 hypothetical protein [Clostridioides difficile]MBH7488424.1 hypothetical protein [Clostridioides difficile]MBY1672374.1 hypothetical protein [Clostridioides difficile]MBY1793731.1 hypothetical protein [Clostridioides difficile]MBY1997457.1 hypothetical protein [Clostridioides difficile]
MWRKFKKLSLLKKILVIFLIYLVVFTVSMMIHQAIQDSKNKNKVVENNVTEEHIISKEEKEAIYKEDMQAKIDSLIPEDLKDKTTYYVNILTPTEGDGYIVSIQVENSIFNDESECRKFAKEFVNNIKDINNISSVRINFIVDVTLTYNVFLDDWNSIKNDVNLIDDLDFSSGN